MANGIGIGSLYACGLERPAYCVHVVIELFDSAGADLGIL